MTASFEQLYDDLAARLIDEGVDVAAVESRLKSQRLETPSWGYAASGTRFGVFVQPGLPRTTFEKVEDAGEVQRHTGIARLLALHIPWDKVDDWQSLKTHAAEQSLSVGTINPNLFQDQRFRLGSLTNPDRSIREHAHRHLMECVEIARELDAPAISLWIPDGTNYPGQDSLRLRRERLLEGLEPVSSAAAAVGVDVLLEYKFYEPAFYATELADWGSALLACQRLGPSAKVLVDLGHHAAAVNIEQIVSILLTEGRLGGIHLNARRYGDDDLIVGSVNPLDLFLIYVELAAALPHGLRQMIDQSHNVEPKIEGMIESVLNTQEAYAKALVVDRARLELAQLEGDVLGAHRILMHAFKTDVRPLCAKVRAELGGAIDPVNEHRQGGYLEQKARERADGLPASWS